jgi:hypothetical protein
VRAHRPRAIWSTFPIPTAHLIGHALHRLTGIPWVADFRDPMVQQGDPADPALWKAYERVERLTLSHAQLNVFTTEGTLALYQARYPQVAREQMAVVENGYDEEVFTSLTDSHAERGSKLVLLHSGAIYPLERDPSRLFAALRRLRDEGVLSPGSFLLRLRATGHDAAIGQTIRSERVGDLVELAPPLPYRDAILEMMHAAGLVVLQADEVQTQIPAKVYEYLRAGRPILALTDPGSDTGQLMRRAGVSHIARLDSVDAIADAVRDFVQRLRDGSLAAPGGPVVSSASRRNRTRELAALLDRVAEGDAAVKRAHAGRPQRDHGVGSSRS